MFFFSRSLRSLDVPPTVWSLWRFTHLINPRSPTLLQTHTCCRHVLPLLCVCSLLGASASRQGQSCEPSRRAPQSTSKRGLRDPFLAAKPFQTILCARCILFGSLYHPQQALHKLRHRPQEGRVARARGQPASPRRQVAAGVIPQHQSTPRTS